MNHDALFLRARRRYRALLRESAALSEEGHKDVLVERELRRLEEEYPSLKEHNNVEAKVTDTLLDSKCVTNPDTGVSQYLSVADSSKSNNDYAEKDQPVRNTSQEKSFFNVGNVAPVLKFGTTVLLAFVSTCLCLWNGTNLPFSLGVTSCFLIILFSSISTVLHVDLVDPLSPLGKVVSPMTLGCFVHFWNILLSHRKKTIYPSLLFQYLLLEFIPSMVMSLVVSVITAILVAPVNDAT